MTQNANHAVTKKVTGVTRLPIKKFVKQGFLGNDHISLLPQIDTMDEFS